jgi:ABC-2 type transport system permease protein
MLRAMALSLVRDRGALALAFLLPPLIFVIFAAVFSGTGGTELRLKVAIGGAAPAALQELQTLLRKEDMLRLLPAPSTRTGVATLVEAGEADAGLFVAADLATSETTPLLVLVDPSKLMAGGLLAGELQRLINEQMPQIALRRTALQVESVVGGFTPEQRARFKSALQGVVSRQSEAAPGSGLIRTEPAGPAGSADPTVTYYAGAVAILFLLFSAMQSAASLIEERSAGILDRVAVGPAGTDVVVFGKFLFLTGQGVLQAALIFLVAALLHDVRAAEHAGGWLLITLAAAAAAAGLALAVASACTTRQQALTVSTFVVLVSSAIGGSMVPRFMMPPWLQDLGWFTPNAWAVEAYHRLLWRGDAVAGLLPEILSLVAVALAGLACALAVSRFRLRF